MESHSFLSLPADTTMVSYQGTQPSKMNKREATSAFIETYRLLPGLWNIENRYYIIMADVTSKQQMPAFYFFIHHSHTQKKTHRSNKNLTNLMGNLCFARERSVQFSVQYIIQLNCTVLLRVYGALYTENMALCLERYRLRNVITPAPLPLLSTCF
jgi:hypothetical protein